MRTNSTWLIGIAASAAGNKELRDKCIEKLREESTTIWVDNLLESNIGVIYNAWNSGLKKFDIKTGFL